MSKQEYLLLFASDFCVFDLKVLPTAATLTGTDVVHLTDTAHERYGTSVVVGTVMVGLRRIRSHHLKHCLHFFIFLRKLWESKNPCSWFLQSGKRHTVRGKDLKCVYDVTFTFDFLCILYLGLAAVILVLMLHDGTVSSR